ncbi:FAD-dependent oxidoreductase [Streptomyces sp. NPDC087263]|uniref:FAD-dependent oxidoreductase n=1 Tax=Streptomyces sp. NPDC087263 TaxID=3365773 RepID=UPI00382F209A
MSDDSAAVFERLSVVTTPKDARVLIRTAHVLGGSIGGLLAARVLADHAERVVIVEPDRAETTADGEPRPGVPQGYQVHTLLPGGRAQLERWYPGIVQQALNEGAVLSGPQRATTYLDDVEQIATPNAELVTSSRPFLEALIRSHTLRLPNVHVITGRVTGLNYASGAVGAVRYTADGKETVDTTDFVLDATGRSSRLSDWLDEGGWPRPRMERLKVDIRYFTACFKRSPDWTGPTSGINRYSPRFASRGLATAAVNAIENQKWALMLAYFGGESEHRGPESFFSRCRELPPVYQEAAAGELLGEVVSFRHPDSRWRHFESLDRFPARLAAVGDAVASFNPVFGQGISSAALHASCLSEYLRSKPDLDAPARHFFDLQQVVVRAAWEISTAADSARLGVARKPTTVQEHRQAWAMQQVMAAAGRDVQVATAFRAVSYMTAHPATLFAPELVRRAAAGNGVSGEEFVRAYGLRL